MCGRFVLFTTGEALAQAVGDLPGVQEVVLADGTPPARWNIAPTHQVALVRAREGVGDLSAARWGLLPHWKKDDSGPALFNARAETVTSKPSFRSAFRNARGLIPLDGYYEWHEKTPYFVQREDRKLLWAAALWTTGTDILSTTMVTTESAEPIDWLHNRLPRFLTEDEIPTWLCGTADEASALLHPAPGHLRKRLRWQEADPAVGRVGNDYPKLTHVSHSRLL